MTDTIDQAQEFEQMRRDHALQRRVPRPQTGTMHCTDCGVEIPAARRHAMPTATHCFDCQEDEERRP